MCYNYSINKKPGELKKRYKATFEEEENFSLVFHTSGFTFSKLPVITGKDPGNIDLFNWGLIPFWNKEKTKALEGRSHTLNAKCETAFEKPSFRASIKSKRCLVPALAFMNGWIITQRNTLFSLV